MKKHVFPCALMSIALLLAPGAAALAEAPGSVAEYRVLAYPFDDSALVSFIFGEPNPADMERREDPVPGRDGKPVPGFFYRCYYPKSEGIVPGFSLCRDVPFPGVMELGARPFCGVAGHNHNNSLFDDFEPSGVAKVQFSREEAVQKAEAVMGRLGLGDYRLSAVLATGALGGDAFPPAYTIRYRQTLNGWPVYWGAVNASTAGNPIIQSGPGPNMICVSFCDAGLCGVKARWSAFEPQGGEQPLVGGDVAKAELRRYGLAVTEVELCYLLLPKDAEENLALPACRYQDAYVNAITGLRVQ